jgi:PKD repeat protein
MVTGGLGGCNSANGSGSTGLSADGTNGTKYGSGGGGGGDGTHVSGAGMSGVLIISYETPTGGNPILANFTASPNPSSAGNPVTLTDTSTGSPTTWNWTIDGVITNTTQNAAYIFSSAGTHTIDLNVTNSTGSFSNLTKTQTVVNASGFNQQDVYMTPHFTVTLNIKDSTNAPIPVVTVTDSNGQSYTTSNGTAYFTEDAGAVVFYFASTGYVSKAASYIVDEDATHTVQLVTTIPSPVPNTNTIFSPRLVRLRAVDNWRTPLTPVTITASYIADTLPNNDPVYLQNAFGVSESVVSLMMNSSVAMSGVTGIDGSNTFSMFPALTYNITVTNETMGVHCQQNLAPADTDYVLFCPTDAQKAAVIPLSQTLNRSYIWITEPNTSFVTINASYQDPTGLTSNVLFNVTVVDNNTVIYSKNFGNPGTSQVLDNYTMPNIRGMQIKSYLAYNRSA